MPDQRSVMKEFRLLDQKRAAQGLTPAEEARHEQLRDLMGPEMGAGGLAGGFDVNAAAARLRESLLPAGLRNRPPPEPEAALPVDLPTAEPTDASPFAADALAAAWDAQPFAPLDGEPGAASPDSLFDPASLGTEGDLAAQGYDPNGYAADPNAPQAWDPNAYAADPNAPQAYDPNAYPADPNAEQAWDPNAYAADPNAPQAYDPNAYPADPNAPQAYDPNAYPADPNAPQAWDPNAYAADPNAPQAWDPNAYAADPNAPQAYDPSTYPADPNAEQAWDPSALAAEADAQPAYDPNAYADPNAPQAWDPNAEQPYDPSASPPDPNAQPAFDPSALAADPGAEQAWDPNAYAADPSTEQPFDPGAYDVDPHAGQPLDPNAFAAEPDAQRAFDPSEPEAAPFTAPAPADDAAALDADPSALDVPGYPPPADDGLAAGWDAIALPAPAADPGAPLGEYDGDAAAAPSPEGLEALLPFDAAAESAIPADAFPGTYAGGAYDETAGFGAPAGSDAGDLAPDAPAPEPGAALEGGLDLETPVDGGATGWAAEPELVAGEPLPEGEWQPEAALEQGFQLESGGSFDVGAAAAQVWDAPAETASPMELAAEAAPATAQLGTWDGGDLAPPEAPQDLGDAPPPELGMFDGDLAAPEAEPEVTADPAAAAALLGSSGGDLAAPEAEDVGWTAPAWTPPAEPELAAAEPEPSPLDLAAPALAAEEDIPTIDGEELLEELPAEELSAPPPVSIDFDPLPPSPAPAVVPAAPEPEVDLDAEAVDLGEMVEEAPAPAASTTIISGSHRVVVHTMEGQVKRGVLEDAELAAAALALGGAPGAAAEAISTDKVKAIFFMLAPGEEAPAPAGKKVRVTFRDGRQVAGFSPDYRENAVGFFMIPADTRTNTARIWVYQAAVRQVAVS